MDITTVIQKFLGFPRVTKGKIRLFAFKILPFGLTSTPFSWTISQILEIKQNYEKVKRKSEFVRETLTDSGYVPNTEKSTWERSKFLTCSHVHNILRLFDG